MQYEWQRSKSYTIRSGFEGFIYQVKGSQRCRELENNGGGLQQHLQTCKTCREDESLPQARYNNITPISAIYCPNKANNKYKHSFRGNNKSHNSKPEENMINQALECYPSVKYISSLTAQSLKQIRICTN